jgi:hypothetical protein
MQQKNSNPLNRILSRLQIGHLWALTIIIGIFIFVNMHPIRPHDFWWHTTIGREILTTGRIPEADIYSYTMAGMPYPSYQAFWLMEVAMFLIYNLGGPVLIVLAQSLIITLAYALLLWLGRRISGSWRSAAIGVIFAAATGIGDWNVRPQAVTFAIAALFLLAIHEYRQTRQRIWLLAFPLGMIVWVNSHGTFPLGLFLIGCWIVDEGWLLLQDNKLTWQNARHALQTPVLVLVVTVAACIVSPRGVGTFVYVSGMSTNAIIQNMVTEWAAPSFDTLVGQLFLSSLLLSAAILAVSPKRPTPSQLLTFLAFGVLGLRTLRGSVWFGLTMAPILAEHVERIVESAKERISESARKHESTRDTTIPTPYSPLPTPQTKIQNTLNVTLVGLLLLGAFVSLPWFKALWPLSSDKVGLISAETPVAATEFLLRERPPGNLFHAMGFGSYLIWAAHPAYPVFVDPRIELYTVELWMDYVSLSTAAPGWEERLDQYGIQTLMLNPEEQMGLLNATRESGQWDEIYTDSASVILTRKN